MYINREGDLQKIRPYYNVGLIKVLTGKCVKIGLNREKPYKYRFFLI